MIMVAPQIQVVGFTLVTKTISQGIDCITASLDLSFKGVSLLVAGICVFILQLIDFIFTFVDKLVQLIDDSLHFLFHLVPFLFESITRIHCRRCPRHGEALPSSHSMGYNPSMGCFHNGHMVVFQVGCEVA